MGPHRVWLFKNKYSENFCHLKRVSWGFSRGNNRCAKIHTIPTIPTTILPWGYKEYGKRTKTSSECSISSAKVHIIYYSPHLPIFFPSTIPSCTLKTPSTQLYYVLWFFPATILVIFLTPANGKKNLKLSCCLLQKSLWLEWFHREIPLHHLEYRYDWEKFHEIKIKFYIHFAIPPHGALEVYLYADTFASSTKRCCN